MRPFVSHRLKLFDPVSSFSRQPEAARQFKPILIENPEKSGEIELLKSPVVSLLNHPLLLEAEPVHNVLFPPLIRDGGQMRREETYEFSSCDVDQIIHRSCSCRVFIR